MNALKEFYKKIGRGGKMEFAFETAAELKISPNTVLKWCGGFPIPNDENVLSILSRKTGIPVEELRRSDYA